MTQFYFLDESGDPGDIQTPGASSHFVIAMVQLSQWAPLFELVQLRQEFHLPATFEFRYYSSKERQKAAFFDKIRDITFRARVLSLDKRLMRPDFKTLNGQELTVELIAGLTQRASELDLANDVLVVDGATTAFRRAIRTRLSHECARSGRVRPFGKIMGANSYAEDGLQLADMIAGAVRAFVSGQEASYYRRFRDNIVDFWTVS